MFVDVFRFENTDGVGPYQIDQLDGLLAHHNSSAKHPPPREDRLLLATGVFDIWHDLINRDYRFGFSTIEQMKAWFDDVNIIQAMEEAGVSLYMMTVQCNHPDDVLHGQLQAMFLKSRVVRRQQLRAEEFYY